MALLNTTMKYVVLLVLVPATDALFAADMLDQCERLTGTRPSDGAFFAALKIVVGAGLVTKHDGRHPTYRITAAGHGAVRELRHLLNTVPSHPPEVS